MFRGRTFDEATALLFAALGEVRDAPAGRLSAGWLLVRGEACDANGSCGAMTGKWEEGGSGPGGLVVPEDLEVDGDPGDPVLLRGAGREVPLEERMVRLEVLLESLDRKLPDRFAVEEHMGEQYANFRRVHEKLIGILVKLENIGDGPAEVMRKLGRIDDRVGMIPLQMNAMEVAAQGRADSGKLLLDGMPKDVRRVLASREGDGGLVEGAALAVSGVLSGVLLCGVALFTIGALEISTFKLDGPWERPVAVDPGYRDVRPPPSVGSQRPDRIGNEDVGPPPSVVEAVPAEERASGQEGLPAIPVLKEPVQAGPELAPMVEEEISGVVLPALPAARGPEVGEPGLP